MLSIQCIKQGKVRLANVDFHGFPMMAGNPPECDPICVGLYGGSDVMVSWRGNGIGASRQEALELVDALTSAGFEVEVVREPIAPTLKVVRGEV